MIEFLIEKMSDTRFLATLISSSCLARRQRLLIWPRFAMRASILISLHMSGAAAPSWDYAVVTRCWDARYATQSDWKGPLAWSMVWAYSTSKRL